MEMLDIIFTYFQSILTSLDEIGEKIVYTNKKSRKEEIENAGYTKCI